MKNRILLFLILLFATSANAQKYNVFKGDTINRTDAKGLKQGLWKKYYSNDVLFSEGVYIDGKHSGTFKTFYKSGKPQSILKFRGLTEINDAEIFSEDSGLMAKGKVTMNNPTYKSIRQGVLKAFGRNGILELLKN